VYAPNRPGVPAEDISSRRLVQAASDGITIAYVGDPSSIGGTGAFGPGAGNTWLATHTATGWETTNISPPNTGSNTIFESFTPSLTSWTVRWTAPLQGPHDPLSDEAPTGCVYGLYSRGASGYASALTEAQAEGPEACGTPHLAGTAKEDTEIYFQSEAALTPGSVEAEPAPEGHDTTNEECSFSCNLYVTLGGKTNQINILPGGEDAPNATYGGPSETKNAPDFSNAITPDGTHAFWTDTGPGPDHNHIYVAGATFINEPVSIGPAKYWTATPDGRYAYYTEAGELLRYDTATKARTTIAGETGGEPAGVEGVIGAGTDGEYVYLVATGKLAENTNAEEEHAEVGADNVYVSIAGTLRFIARVDPADNNIEAAKEFTGQGYGDWQPDLGSRTAEVTADGHDLIFASGRPLTHYDNSDTANGKKEMELYRYDATANTLGCVSCMPSGAPPPIPIPVEAEPPVTPSFSDTHMTRWISADGTRIFLTSYQQLAPGDTNRTLDVYEWEQAGTAGCPRAASPVDAGGCIYLLSGGEGAANSYFLEASVSGNDVFFTTRQQLLREGRGDKTDLYDVRVEGGFTTPTAGCAPSACEPPPPLPPATPLTPQTATSTGTGNLPAPATVKPKPSATTRAQRLKKALRQCRRVRRKAPRTRCERHARSLYGPVRSKKTSKGSAHR
jgi:hypothetical protein